MVGRSFVLRVSYPQSMAYSLSMIADALDLTNASLYTYFIDNQQTLARETIVFGLRELNATEIADRCSRASAPSLPKTDQRRHFSANYELRLYTSGCYYLNANYEWLSDGLVVRRSLRWKNPEFYSVSRVL